MARSLSEKFSSHKYSTLACTSKRVETGNPCYFSCLMLRHFRKVPEFKHVIKELLAWWKSEVYSWRRLFSLQWLHCFFPSKRLLMVFFFVHLETLLLLPDFWKTSWVRAEHLQNEWVEICSETKLCIFRKVLFQASVVKWDWFFLSHIFLFHYSDVLLSLLSCWYHSHI